MAPTLSLIIPTHKRAAILARCLEHIEAQTARDALEVIVVSDGPDTPTRELMERKIAETPDTFPRRESMYRYIETPKAQQGVARNRGVAEARAPIVLFVGDDIFLDAAACAQHIAAHAILNKKTTEAEAVLGFTTWDPALKITPVMRWLERSGWQFGYPRIEPYAGTHVPPEIQHRYTYTSHISVPTDVAKNHPFREDVSLYGWEDIEWGLRLAQADIRLFYQKNARAYHHHPMMLEQSLQRMETLGKSAVIMERSVPGLSLTPKGWKRMAYGIAQWLPTMRGRHMRALLKGIYSPSSS